jgi:hypothetical protein
MRCFANPSTFYSNAENRAAEIAPDLCPLGKHGYDPRCRNWYVTGKTLFDEAKVPVHITAPYPFALKKNIGASITSPIANPQDGSYVGQSLIDFSPQAVQDTLIGLPVDIPFIITPERDRNVSDTVQGPFRDDNDAWQMTKILDLIFEHDVDGSHDRETFAANILTTMKEGGRGNGSIFYRTGGDDDGSKERWHVLFEPVFARVLLAIDPSDYYSSAGVNATDTLVYTVGIAYSQNSVCKPWEMFAKETAPDVVRTQRTYIMITVGLSALFVVMAYIVSVVYFVTFIAW